MARPTKIGLEYFSLDIDLFEDEKVVPISSEFGAKGECVLIRVLCAIYRNGYFAECSEAFKFKIAKQANLPHNLVSEVIAGLVKWGFFDKAVFDSFSVLTSKGIQKRWKEATRKRVIKNELDYWILEFPTQKQWFLPPETPLNQSESTQSKVKESKVNKRERKEKIPPPENPIFEKIKNKFDLPLSECKKEFISDELHIHRLKKQFGENVIEWINKFFEQLELEGISEKSLMDAKSHFTRWYQLKSKENGNSKSNSWNKNAVSANDKSVFC